jgi:enoyl-[acyl-carrier protein] reductase I
MGFMQDKKVLIVGLANNRSIAWGIAQAMHREGAQLAFTYQNDKLKDRVETLAAECGSHLTCACDVSRDEDIQGVFDYLSQHWGDGLDGIVHSVAYAPRRALEGDYLTSVDREAFRIAHDISSYSFAALAKALRTLLRPGAALLTLSYLGAERVIPNYNVMGLAKASLEANVRYLAASLGPFGIRVNAISAGPIRTLAASGISNFREMLSKAEKVSPLRRNVTIEEVGNAAAFLCSDLAAGITGEVIYVDAGYHIVGLAFES